MCIRYGVLGYIGLGLTLSMGAGEPAKVAPYVTTPEEVVEVILDLADLREGETLYDLGSGDGRIVLAAVNRVEGTTGVGIEIDSALVALSQARAGEMGLTDRVRFLEQDLFATPLYGVDVVTLYLMPRANLQLRPKLFRELQPGARVVSHDFSMGEWEPEEMRDVRIADPEGLKDQHLVYLWVMPGNVSGRWEWKDEWDGEEMTWQLELSQRFQKVTGKLQIGEKQWDLDDAGMRGDIFWAWARADFGNGVEQMNFSGTLSPAGLQGILEMGAGESLTERRWDAIRTEGRQSSIHPDDPDDPALFMEP